MTPEERTRLEALKLRLAARRRRSEEGQYLRPILPLLRAARVRGRRLSPAQVRQSLGGLADGPGRDERLDWAFVPRGACASWADRTERDALVIAALAACCGPSEPVAVIWHTHSAGLRLPASDLGRVVGPVLDAAPEIWICAARPDDWLIECARFDQEVCVRPPASRADERA